ncbi:MAG: hypothetical protein M1818_003893 [Claussenomyces sp. TS43310]|nr:MAG: hypothetical protein M1818_003893 [Claussenomyces sp. TS43310]
METGDEKRQPLLQEPTAKRSFNDLPPELLDNIVNYLDAPAPSASRLHAEPDYNITYSEARFLKSASLVCRRWRISAMPLLYRHVCLKIHNYSTPFPILTNEDGPFFDFIDRYGLRCVIESFTLCIKDTKALLEAREPQENNCKPFWARVFTDIDPDTLTIVASPQVLQPLTSCHVWSDDSWSFDMPYHILQLRRPTLPNKSSSCSQRPSEDVLEARPLRHSVLLHSRPWTSLLLNEGSFIRSFTQYEFFNKRPPSLLPDLLGSEAGIDRAMLPSTVRELSYIAMFPTSTHFNHLTSRCPRLDRLYVQFVPRSDVLRDPAQMDHVDTNDLWLERNSCYALVMRELFNHPPSGNFQFLREFESGDHADIDGWEMAVEYVRRANLSWRVDRPGVFVRVPEDGEGEEGEDAVRVEQQPDTLPLLVNHGSA